ncbi:MAG TPA: nuclear transport factor 2 family protein [Ktedonobacterales bacterium]|nr:nuclear transport factor 2 family protein [Ktedonobacterales bacterium]
MSDHDERVERVEQAIRNHIAAFNAHDLQRLLAGLADDAVWQTGRDTFRGRPELATLFQRAFSAIAPRLTIRSLLIDQDKAACEMVEHMAVDGDTRQDFIAGFYRVDDDGIIRTAKIYRQGSADI